MGLIENLKAAIGDRLLADKPLSKEYAWAVIEEVESAIAEAAPFARHVSECDKADAKFQRLAEAWLEKNES